MVEEECSGDSSESSGDDNEVAEESSEPEHQKTLAMNPLIRQQQKKAAMPIVAVRQRLPRRLL
jgi:hypothetical protein